MLDEHRAAQRERILEVALELLEDKGMAVLTMSSLAARAGMSRATLYHYFPDVDAVLAAWVGREMERSLDAMLADARRVSDPFERLALLVDSQVLTFSSQHHRLSAEHFESEAVAPAVRAEVERRMAPLRELIALTIGEAQADAGVPERVDPGLAADLLLGLLGAARRRLVAGSVAPAEVTAALLGLLRNGWLARPGS
ncbi:MAG: TetR/AcrR family transcriptional regulator [Actinomycetota bacterium]|nr:TetR/AcrR family transcriptional regulator [Actinomycetota bacterium]